MNYKWKDVSVTADDFRERHLRITEIQDKEWMKGLKEEKSIVQMQASA